ncbi:hypothetical protein DBV15_10520 [Temnothorax longispinosus]|uniref:Uncharacterized protein n=1 Tax=Temnothorax longispinosus TaxID=300112 RepID=A0A4S2KN71_9HYME|nr:hypothetical protein DBV15_10520 [Temnothorax longispinosus]
MSDRRTSNIGRSVNPPCVRGFSPWPLSGFLLVLPKIETAIVSREYRSQASPFSLRSFVDGSQQNIIMPKDFQLLSKGQKDQLIQIELNRYKDSKLLLHSTPLNISSNLLDKAEIVSISSDSTSCGSHTSPSYVNEINELSIESQFETQNNEEQDIEIKYNVSEVTNVSDCTNNITLRDDLQTFIIDCNIAHDAASDLLTILRKHGHVDLPKDVRLLFQNQQCWRPRTVNGANCSKYMHYFILPVLLIM